MKDKKMIPICPKCGVTTDVTGWCKEWKHVLKRNLYRINLDVLKLL